MSEQHHTLREITSQPSVWAATLDVLHEQADGVLGAWHSARPSNVLFIGCGSTYYLSRTAAALFQETAGRPARGVPSSELLLFPSQVLANPAETLLVAISRSGTTTETQQAVKQFRRAGGQAVWAITCYPHSELAGLADLTLAAEAAQETSIAQTRSFSSMLLLAQGMAALIGDQDTRPLQQLPVLAGELLDEVAPEMEALGRARLESYFFLGSGLQYGIANEGMLKMKEMSLSHSEAFHFLEFRHGPKSIVGPHSLVAGLVSAEAAASERQVLEEMDRLGATVLEVTEGPPLNGVARTVQLPAALPAWARPGLYLLPLQLLAYHRTIAKGLNPDSPRHLDAVVTLDPAQFSVEI